MAKNHKKKKSGHGVLWVMIVLIMLLVLALIGVKAWQEKPWEQFMAARNGATASSELAEVPIISSVVEEPESSVVEVSSSVVEETTLVAEELTSSELEETDGESDEEKAVYTFLQGPKAYESETEWSGSWCKETYDGNLFSVFGCGMCCMANVYNTLSDYECDPVDTYYYAKKVSSYKPTKGSAAIGWGALKQTMRSTGMDCEIYQKDETYEGFRDMIKDARSAIVLISSEDDDSYWKDTGGHYVNIWLYNEGDETVFLAEPGDPEKNRTRIPLETVYNALKTQSAHQYLLISGYDKDNDAWKHSKGIAMEWIAPDYYTEKNAEKDAE